jgi:hypothetical protein
VLTRVFTLDMPDAAAARIVGLIVTLPPVTFWRARVEVDKTFCSWVESVRSRRDPATPVLLLTMPTMAAYCTGERWVIRWVMARPGDTGAVVNHAHNGGVLHGRIVGYGYVQNKSTNGYRTAGFLQRVTVHQKLADR